MRTRDVLERVVIPNSGYMGAIAFLAIVAYPDKDEYHKRDKLLEASKAWILKAATKKGSPERAEVYDQYRQYRNQQIDGKLSQLEKRLYKRLQVAELAQETIRENLFASYLPDDEKRTARQLRLMHLAEVAQIYDVTESEKTFKKREWKPSLPVLHYAIALLILVLNRKKFSIFELVQSPEWLPEVIESAAIQASFIDNFMDDDFPRIACVPPRGV